MTLAQVRPDILYAWKGPSLLIVDTRGDAGDSHSLTGYYYREARFLRTCRLEINGERPWLCESAATAPDVLAFSYTYPEVAEYGGGGSGQSNDEEPVDRRGLPQRGVMIRLAYRVTVARLEVLAHLENRSRQRLTFDVAWALDADFADIQEAQSDRRQQEGRVATRTTSGTIEFGELLHLSRLGRKLQRKGIAGDRFGVDVRLDRPCIYHFSASAFYRMQLDEITLDDGVDEPELTRLWRVDGFGVENHA